MKHTYSLLFILILIFSCGKTDQPQSEDNTQEKYLLSVKKTHSKIEPILPVFEKEVEDWKELNAVHTFLQRFETVSPKEALVNALELRDITESLIDSVKPKQFDVPPLNARIHVFFNETLRLADITYISAIKASEVNAQVENVITTFSSVNSKINTMLLKRKFEDEVDIDFDFIGLDSTRIDSVTRKSIRKKQKKTIKPLKIINNLSKTKQ